MGFVGVLTSGLPVIWLVESSLLPILELNPINLSNVKYHKGQF